MTPDKKTELKTDNGIDPVQIERLCLKCGTKFPSQWSGERICPKCKTTSSWRQGHDGLSKIG
jgi:hypothetical protein